jgi:dUTP pyrophosphatase
METLIVEVKLKKLVEHAEVPKYSRSGDAGLDLVAIDCYHNSEYDYVEYGTGLAIQIPTGYVGLLFPRSSISKTPHLLCNSVGVIDSNYTGEIKLRFKKLSNKEHLEYNVGDRIGQLLIVPYPTIDIKEVDELESTNRGSLGFGSSGD